MTKFTIHTEETAPEASKPFVQGAVKAFGFLPNLTATFAESPAMVEAYGVLSGIFEKTDLNATERQIVLMTTSRLNECTYCMAAHTTVSQMQKVPADVVEALRYGIAIRDSKLQALQTFTARIHATRGNVTEADLQAFFDAGYTKGNVLDVILGAGLKTLSNYTNHVVQTPVDSAFQHNAWQAFPEAVA